jgi:glycosyltransferase involved in cell wall biosynthesis
MRPIAVNPTDSIDEFMRQTSTRPTGTVGNVVIVSDSVPERNGVGAYYQDLTDQLAEQCNDVGFLCPDGKHGFLRIPLPGDPTQKIWIPSYRKFSAMMERIQPECIIAATPGPYGLLGCFFAQRRKIPFVVGFHTHFSGVTDQYNNRFLRGFSRFYFNCADWAMFRYADLVLGNSEAMVELALKLGARRAEVMGTLLPVGALSKPVTDIRPEVRKVIFAGRLAPEKRVHWILEAAEQLPDIQFDIAGDGPLNKDVQKAATRLGNVNWLGWVDRNQLLAAVDDADMLVLPSVVESFGTVALEAMARGRLVLVTPTCGIVEWPDLARNLFVIADGESVSEAIRRICAMASDERQRIATEASNAARRLNTSSINHWLSLLETSQQHSSDG